MWRQRAEQQHSPLARRRPARFQPLIESLEDRWLPSVSLDSGFGFIGSGQVQTKFSTYAVVNSVAVQPNGDIVAVGYTMDASGDMDWAVARYDPSGNLEWQSFTDLGSTQEMATAVTSQGNKTLVAGWTGVGNNANFALACYLPDGTLDPAFGPSTSPGITVNDLEGPYIPEAPDYAQAIVVLGGGAGEILVAGSSAWQGQSTFAIARYDSTGILEDSFSSYHAIDPGTVSLALQPESPGSSEDKLILAGSLGGTFVVQRLWNNGNPDDTFNNGLSYAQTFMGPLAQARCVGIGPSRGIIVGGFTGTGGTALAKFLPDGTYDPGFNGDGTAMTGTGAANGLFVQPNGTIITAGQNVVQAFLPNGHRDTSFGTNGQFALGTATSLNCAERQPDGKILVAGSAQFGDGSSVFLVTRLDLGYSVSFAALFTFASEFVFPPTAALKYPGGYHASRHDVLTFEVGSHTTEFSGPGHLLAAAEAQNEPLVHGEVGDDLHALIGLLQPRDGLLRFPVRSARSRQ
jgi:uncharacterized delta-60 repeat protein